MKYNRNFWSMWYMCNKVTDPLIQIPTRLEIQIQPQISKTLAFSAFVTYKDLLLTSFKVG